MKKSIAERELLYSLKGASARNKFVVRISAPYLIEENTVNFKFHPGAAACQIEFDGLPESLVEEVHGVDSIQALALAANVDPYLKGLEKKYDFYWITGEPYFEE
ncbi:MAG: hypothetical protein ACYDC8_15275 [Gammaproteobacteria bacterium]